MDPLGNALTLYELGVRIVTFINDLRHAQDDFLALRAEADCLRVCLNSLGSESCQDTIYLYISHKQREDLELILQNTLLNMEDLNRFLGGTKALIANEAKKMARRQGAGSLFKNFMKNAWARYKFVMTDVQPFRDKLVIPTQSVQIFLQSMTHVGLANVGNMLSLSGHLPGRKDLPGMSTGPAGSWEMIGTRIAFKKAKDLDDTPLTADLEAEIIRYVLHLLQGGTVFDEKTDEKTKEVAREKRLRSKSQTTGSSGRDRGYDTFVVRRKTAYVSSPTRRAEVSRDAAWSATERRSLTLKIPPSSPTPRSPVSPTSPRIFDAQPQFEVSSDEDDNARPRRHSTSEAASPRRDTAPPEVPGAPSAVPEAVKDSSSRFFTREKEDVKSSRQMCRQKVEDDIKHEQEQAAQELRRRSVQMRAQRRTQQRAEARVRRDQERQGSSSEDEDDMIEWLQEQYGLRAEKLFVNRDVVDNGTVVPHVPAPLVSHDEPAETSAKPDPPKKGARLTSETCFYDASTRSKRSRYTRPREVPESSRHAEFVARPPQYPRYADSRSGSSDEGYRTSRLRRSTPSGPNVIVIDHDHDREEGSDISRRRDNEGSTERRRPSQMNFEQITPLDSYQSRRHRVGEYDEGSGEDEISEY